MLSLLIIFAISFAQNNQNFSFHNHYSSGSVKVELHHYQLDENGNRVEAKPGTVLPGEEVSYIPVLTNNRADCYVRVHIDVDMSDDKAVPAVGTNDIKGWDNNWIKKGDEYYYKPVLRHGESLDIFQGLNVPSSWTQKQHGSSNFAITVVADAIQSNNLYPDYKSDLPWGSVKIESEKEFDPIDYCRTIEPFTTPNELMIRGDGGLESRSEDLFSNFSYFMAGDTYDDTLLIRNKSDKRIRVYFKMKNKAGALSDKTELGIKCRGRELCNAPMNELADAWERLVSIDAGKEANLKFSLHMPDDSMREYTVLKDDAIWQFKVVSDEATSGDARVATGDRNMLIMWTLILACGVISLGALLYRRK